MRPCLRTPPLAVLALLATLAGCGSSRPRPQAADRFSPYVDVTLAGANDLTAQARSAGLRALTLAFVTAVGNSCRAGWGGQDALASGVPASAVTALRAAGIEPTVSFGGRDGPELAQACATPAALAGEYQRVIDAYRLTRLDFDLEGAALASRAVNARRWRAIALLQAGAQRARRALQVTVTLPLASSGLPRDELTDVRAAVTAGVRLDRVNLLAMDYGPDAAGADMAALARTASAAALAQLHSSHSAAGLGVTVMVGVNDSPGEVFTLADARRVGVWAGRVGLGGLSMWSLGRDRPCPAGSPPRARPSCSGVAAPALAFSRALGATP